MWYNLIREAICMNYGNRISEFRKSKNITQSELADFLYVTDKTISSWEKNRTEPSLELLIKLSEIFECSVGYLVFGDNPKNNIELEIKIKINEKMYNYLKQLLKDKAKFLNESKQHDIYYQPIHRKFLNSQRVKEWLRIGKRGNKNILTYKNYHDNVYCDEYEVEIDDINNLDKIFEILGLEKIAVVDKVRAKYFYLNKYEISLDKVEKLGYFIEIEVKEISETPILEYEELLRLAKKLNLNLDDIEVKRYPYQIIELNENKY